MRSRNSAQHCQRLSSSRGQPPDLERISPTSSLIAACLSPDDLSGGTYSISDKGAFGTTFTAPIINAPQVAILSTDTIRLRPAVVSTQDGDFVAPRMIGMIGQSFDHRAFDGAYSAAFLSRIKQIVETRNWDEEIPSDL